VLTLTGNDLHHINEELKNISRGKEEIRDRLKDIRQDLRALLVK